MSHPFTTNRQSLLVYIAIWIAVAVVTSILIHLLRDFSLVIALTDSFISILLFGLLGLVAWYPTSYIPFRREAPIYSLLAHIVAGAIVISVWMFVTVGLLGIVFSTQDSFVEYLDESLFWRAFMAVMVYLVLVLIYYLISYARSLREKAQAEEKLKTLVKESELNMLKSQINPHFLFNSLNSISSLIMTSPDEAREMIIRLSDFLRYSLKHRENEFVSLEEEVGRMKDYLAIEQVRFGDKLHYELEMKEECKKMLVPTMILQPLIENAIKHGVYESLEPVSVSFKCSIQDDYIKLDLQNDFDPEQPSVGGTGVGLQNVSERLRLAYDGRGRLHKTINGTVFLVTLIIPVKTTQS